MSTALSGSDAFATTLGSTSTTIWSTAASRKELRADLVHHAAGPLHDDAAMLLLRHRHEEPSATAPPFVPSAPQ